MGFIRINKCSQCGSYNCQDPMIICNKCLSNYLPRLAKTLQKRSKTLVEMAHQAKPFLHRLWESEPHIIRTIK